MNTPDTYQWADLIPADASAAWWDAVLANAMSGLWDARSQAATEGKVLLKPRMKVTERADKDGKWEVLLSVEAVFPADKVVAL